MNRIGVTREIAEDIALRVLNYFGYGEEIIDNVLDQDDRSIFYFLQDAKLLNTHWEEIVLPNGRMWRVFYWSLNVPRILEYARTQEEESIVEVGLYDSLPEDVWTRQMA
ncbi:MAG: hypothetical protein GX369_05005 [Euryarchaeota archaeon]|nr:hypothetical protein [Euryarchaeota archaeon]